MRNIVLPLLTVAAFSLPTAPAQAQAPRTFVSAAGSDSNPCSFALPCRHFQAAVMATSAGGEVDALDPAGYGPITITQAITIEGQGWSYIAPPAGGAGITINAVSGNVTIHGVSLNGAGIAGPINGIVFNSGDSLNVKDCVVQNFQSGIIAEPSVGNIALLISNSSVLDNSNAGIYLTPRPIAQAAASIDHVTAYRNNYGIYIDATATNSLATATITNSIISYSLNTGIIAITNNPSASTAYVRESTLSNNSTGISILGVGQLFLSHSMIADSATGINVGSGNAYSGGYNDISNNTTPVNGTLGSTPEQ